MRNITGTLLTATGIPAVGVTVSFNLVDSNNITTSSFVTLTGERISGPFEVITDINGAFTVSLVENTLLTDETYYLVKTEMLGDVPFSASLSEGIDINWLDFKGIL